MVDSHRNRSKGLQHVSCIHTDLCPRIDYPQSNGNFVPDRDDTTQPSGLYMRQEWLYYRTTSCFQLYPVVANTNTMAGTLLIDFQHIHESVKNLFPFFYIAAIQSQVLFDDNIGFKPFISDTFSVEAAHTPCKNYK